MAHSGSCSRLADLDPLHDIVEDPFLGGGRGAMGCTGQCQASDEVKIIKRHRVEENPNLHVGKLGILLHFREHHLGNATGNRTGYDRAPATTRHNCQGDLKAEHDVAGDGRPHVGEPLRAGLHRLVARHHGDGGGPLRGWGGGHRRLPRKCG